MCCYLSAVSKRKRKQRFQKVLSMPTRLPEPWTPGGRHHSVQELSDELINSLSKIFACMNKVLEVDWSVDGFCSPVTTTMRYREGESAFNGGFSGQARADAGGGS